MTSKLFLYGALRKWSEERNEERKKVIARKREEDLAEWFLEVLDVLWGL